MEPRSPCCTQCLCRDLVESSGMQLQSTEVPGPGALLKNSKLISHAYRLCESVAASLVGQRLGSFTRISSAVRVALEAALTRILTPKRSIDVLREVPALLVLPRWLLADHNFYWEW